MTREQRLIYMRDWRKAHPNYGRDRMRHRRATDPDYHRREMAIEGMDRKPRVAKRIDWRVHRQLRAKVKEILERALLK
jgi:hypothetical protein